MLSVLVLVVMLLRIMILLDWVKVLVMLRREVVMVSGKEEEMCGESWEWWYEVR